MASSSSSSSKYPYPSEVRVAEFVPIKLSSTNIRVWKSMLFSLIDGHGLAGFLNGATSAPEKIDSEDYRDWKRTDALIRTWIVSTLPEDKYSTVVGVKTAQQLWSYYETLSTIVTVTVSPELNRLAEKSLSHYLSLIKAARNGDWEEAFRFFEQQPDAVNTAITPNSETVLMITVRSKERNNFLRKLLDMMSPEDLVSVDSLGKNGFHVAAMAGNIEAVKLLTKKNPQLPYILSSDKKLALHFAAGYGHRDVVIYLLTFFQENDPDPNPFADELGDGLLASLIHGALFDLAISVIKRNPKLASRQVSPLSILSVNSHAFPSGSRLNYWQRFIYSLVPELHSDFWKVAEMLVPQVKQIRGLKLMHLQAHDLLEQLCAEIVKLDQKTACAMLSTAFYYAIGSDINEVVEAVLDFFPAMILAQLSLNRDMFHIAILCRNENVFNLVYQCESINKTFIPSKDASLNTHLHLAGSLVNAQVVGLQAKAGAAALQMQRELQWFKEVEKWSSPDDKEERNSSNKTPAMVFTETHAELVTEGEQWFKDSSTSCTVAAALIITVMFAAAITVPGGNNSESSLPFFASEAAFSIFAVSDALALFSSTSSLIMFLSILTSRYAEIDFLYALPKRMIIGLGSLFLSIIFMMIAFAATLQIVFGQEKSWILIPAIAFASLPVTLFVFFQFPLLFNMINSTYGPGIFRKQSDRILF